MKKNAWTIRAGEIAEWAWSHIVNRTDVWGGYLPPQHRKTQRRQDGTEYVQKSVTKPPKDKRGKSVLTIDVARRHFAGESQGDIIGLHSTSPGQTCKWLAYDIDAHDGEDADAKMGDAKKVAAALMARGLHPLLLDSDGKGGFHVWCIFGTPVKAIDLFAFARSILTDAGVAAESFPKQSGETAQYGNWIRLPGRHHTRDHWTRVLGPTGWLDQDAAIDAILAHPESPAESIPAYVAPPPAEKPVTQIATTGVHMKNDREIAAECLRYLSPDAPYDEWLSIGMSLHSVDPALQNEWETWSRMSGKHVEGECARKWQTFKPNGGSTIGSLIHLARRANSAFLVGGNEQEGDWGIYGVLASPPNNPARTRDDPESTHEKPDGEKAVAAPSSLPRPTISNVGEATIKVDGEEVQIRQYRPAPAIMAELLEVSGGWPRSVGGSLFIQKPVKGDLPTGKEIMLVGRPAKLMAWISDKCNIRWNTQEAQHAVTRSKLSPPSKEEFFEYASQNPPHSYDAVEVLPHYPAMENVYYVQTHLPKPPGLDPLTFNASPLGQLILALNPETELDRRLLVSAMLTPGWDGEPGTRPAFVYASRFGRGSGKTATAEIIASIWGGSVSFKPREDSERIRQRLLAESSMASRIVLIDNIKGSMSDGDIESMITTRVIDGHRMYYGQASRLNMLTWFLTSNTPKLSKDLADRSVVIQIGKQAHQTSFKSWAARLVKDHRAMLIAQLIDLLRQPPKCEIPARVADRFQEWQRAVLTRFFDGEALAELILSRRGDVDIDNEQAGEIAACVERLVANEFVDYQRRVIRITRKQLQAALESDGIIEPHKYPRAVTSIVQEQAGHGTLSQLSLVVMKMDGVTDRFWVYRGMDAPPEVPNQEMACLHSETR